MDIECIDLLRNAIILQAVNDWRKSGKYERERIEHQLKNNKLLNDYNFDYIFEKLKEEEYEARTKLQTTRDYDGFRIEERNSETSI